MVMKKTVLLLVLWFFSMAGIGQTQSITLSFDGRDSVTHTALVLEAVQIHNSTAGCDTVLYGDAPTVTLLFPSGTSENPYPASDPFYLFPVIPNPFHGKASVGILLNKPGNLKLILADVTGRVISVFADDLTPGRQVFEIGSSTHGVLFLNAVLGNFSRTIKLVNDPVGNGSNGISYRGAERNAFRAFSASSGFTFRLGDQLEYRSVKTGYFTAIIYDSPTQNSAYTFDLTMIAVAPTVITGNVEEVLFTTATAGGNVTSDGGAAVTERGFCWSESPNPTLTDPHTHDGTGTGYFTSHLELLSSNTTYYGRAYAVNIADTAYGNDTTFTTLPMPDGYYIKGPATAYPGLNENTKMQVTRNEVNQTPDPNLLELYIPVKAGAGGFCIVRVLGSVYTYYGPGSDFTTITAGSPDEPKVPFQRGSYSENPAMFTVPDDGMYHVVIYLNTMRAVVVPVHWGMIGSATSNGWVSSVPMDEPAFNLTSMSWSIDSLALMAGEWKFRYSDGWKVEIDTTVNIGGGFHGVRVNANFGNAVNALVPGGANIVNYEPGYYTCVLEYILGSAFQATLTKTGELPATNWTGVVCDAVGTGISPDNPAATPDTSSWHWGYQMLGDNGGIPFVNGSLYTWTWSNIIIEAYQGFKVRTLNGLPPPSGGASFDAGYNELNQTSSAPELINNGGNLMSTIRASYTITLNIDAGNNDTKELIIVKN